MKRIILFFLSLCIFAVSNARNKSIDNLRSNLKNATVDTLRLQILLQLSKAYSLFNPDSAIFFAQRGYEIAEKYGRWHDEARALNNMASCYATMGNYAKGMQFYLNARRTYVNFDFVPGVVLEDDNIGATYVQKADYKNALPYLDRSNKRWNTYLSTHMVVTPFYKKLRAVISVDLGECYLYTHQIDSAEKYFAVSYLEAKKNKVAEIMDNIERDLGEVEMEKDHKAVALNHLKNAVLLSKAADNRETLSISYLSTAKLYHKYKRRDSAEYYAGKALETAKAGNYQQDLLNAGKMLYTLYDEDHNLRQAYKYFKLASAAKDSLYSQEKVKQLLSIDFEEKQRLRDIKAAQKQYQENVRIYSLIAGLLVLLLLVFIFWRNSRQRQKANLLLQRKNEDVEAALSKLKLTQNQLIQAEKMASLGELTAGIAHEIQNPLNFVNNFSEVNKEMLLELETEIKNGNTEDALALTSDLMQNEEKINHHGKRADGIVKGMLEHSRSQSGQKELVDLNVMADEYMRLSYHGLRAKDKSFNAELITHFDPILPKINVIPQDIGRVMLNLFNNAFYAVNQKQKTAGGDYKPEVSVTSSTENRQVIIKVRDNGIGIPDAIKEKIMQPFFTTKPTGEGTGLGLSLSYDIVVKGHGGKIEVSSKEGGYSEFTIMLPIN